MVFPTTSWTSIRDVQNVSESQRRELLDGLLRRYWKPLYAYFRQKGQTPADAEDLVQGLMNELLAKDKLAELEQSRGRFRSWLRVCARHFLVDHLRHQRAGKRDPGTPLVSFEELAASDGLPFEPAGPDTDDGFADAWRRSVLTRAITLTRKACEDAGRSEDFAIFCRYYCSGESEQLSWKQIAARHNLANWKYAARKADWVKSRLAMAVRTEIRQYVDSESEVDDEIRDLLF